MNEQSGQSGWRVHVVGTGGQGVLTAARLLCHAFTSRGHNVVSGQLHGMAQRGGSVQSSILIDAGICPVIPTGRADYVLGFEPVETARAIPFMSSDTIVYMNTARVVPFTVGQRSALEGGPAEYPDLERLLGSIRAVTRRVHAFDASGVAEEAGDARALNTVLLGCLFGGGGAPLTPETFWSSVVGSLPPRLRETNTRAFHCGVQACGQFHLTESRR